MIEGTATATVTSATAERSLEESLEVSVTVLVDTSNGAANGCTISSTIPPRVVQERNGLLPASRKPPLESVKSGSAVSKAPSSSTRSSPNRSRAFCQPGNPVEQNGQREQPPKEGEPETREKKTTESEMKELAKLPLPVAKPRQLSRMPPCLTCEAKRLACTLELFGREREPLCCRCLRNGEPICIRQGTLAVDGGGSGKRHGTTPLPAPLPSPAAIVCRALWAPGVEEQEVVAGAEEILAGRTMLVLGVRVCERDVRRWALPRWRGETDGKDWEETEGRPGKEVPDQTWRELLPSPGRTATWRMAQPV